MVTDQKHSSDISSKQEVIRYTKKLAQAFGLDKQNAKVYNMLSGENLFFINSKKKKTHQDMLSPADQRNVNDVDELFAMEHCNCSKKSINSSSESSSSEESDSDYAPPEKKVHKVNPGKVMCMEKKSDNKKGKPRRNPI
jgi:hypothetical protein